MNEIARRRTLTFAEAEGVAALPQQLKLRQISPELRARVWELLHSSMCRDVTEDHYIAGSWNRVLFDWHVKVRFLMADEFEPEFLIAANVVRQQIKDGNYLHVFEFLQFALRHPKCPIDWRDVEHVLEVSRAAYRVVDDGFTIMPIASPEEGKTVARAFVDLAATEYNGARKHLRHAVEHLSAGKYADSIRDSIHAVEATARSIDPKDSLGGALQGIESRYGIHAALKRGFGAIYGFTSDEEGIRHPLLDKGDAAVDETDALFMIGACSAFVSYLIGKTRPST